MKSLANIAFITLGCAKNEVDSDKMRAKLIDAGYGIVDIEDDADLVIVNTCSFLASAVEEGISVIFDALGTSAGIVPANKVLVAGCMPSRYGEDLESELTEVAGFLPADQEEHVVEYVDRILGISSNPIEGLGRTIQGPSAYVKVSDGCDRFCSYCMIPYIRGRYHSYPFADIAAEVEGLVEAGVREIVFIGQDTGIWGRDFDEPDTTAHLLERMSDAHPDVWFRLLYIQPEGITDELLTLMQQCKNVCSYIDIPLQHIDGEVLKRMNRTGDGQQIRALIAHVREMVPDICIRTTLMAGFPGETPEQSEAEVEFASEGLVDYAGVFAYSREEGSKAAEFEDQVDEDERLDRAQAVLDACDACGFDHARERVGMVEEVLIEGYEETDAGIEALGRWRGQAPEVDGQVHIPMAEGEELEIGDIVTVRFVDSFCYELEGELL